MTTKPWPAQVIIQTIKENPEITLDGILDMVAITRDEAVRYLRSLVKSGDVEIDTSRRYRIKK